MVSQRVGGGAGRIASNARGNRTVDQVAVRGDVQMLQVMQAAMGPRSLNGMGRERARRCAPCQGGRSG